MTGSFSALVRQLLDERGMSGRQLAGLVNYDRGGMARIISGKRDCAPAIARLIDDALGADGRLIAAAAVPDSERVRLGIEQVIAAGKDEPALLAGWEESVARYGRRAVFVPAPVVLAEITAGLRDLRKAIVRCRSPRARSALIGAAAQLSGLMVHTMIRAGEPKWQQWGDTARRAASEATDNDVLAWVASREAYGHYYAGDFPHAIAIARAAQATCDSCVGGVHAAALEMRARAAMGDAAGAMAACRTAERAHRKLGPEYLVQSAFGYPLDQFAFHRGEALALLGDPAARAELDLALELTYPGDFTNRSLIRLRQAWFMARDGQPDSGLALAAETIGALSPAERQGLITARGRELLASLDPAHQASQAGLGFRDLLEEADCASKTGSREVATAE